MNRDISKLKKWLLSEFKDVFKADLGPTNRLNIPSVNIHVNDDPGEPFNAMMAIETSGHIQAAAKDELARLLK